MYRRKYTFRRRTTRRRFYRSKIQKSRRLFRKFIRRTAIKPELKSYYVENSSINITPNACWTVRLTPTNMPQGTASFNRIGNQLKFVKVDTRIRAVNNSSTNAVAPTRQSTYVRVVIWSPRCDYTTALNYMNGMTEMTNLDFNTITVHRDKLIQLSPPYMREAVDNDIAGGPFAMSRMMMFKIKFPRKVHFSGINDVVDEEKYSMYMTCNSISLDAVFSHQTRTWFIDA